MQEIDGDIGDHKEMVDEHVKNDDQEDKANSKPSCLLCRDNKEERKRNQLEKKGSSQECEPNQREPTCFTNMMRNSTDRRVVQSQCVICLSEYKEGDEICWSSNSDCRHVYHKNCLLSWFTRQARTRSWKNNVHGIHDAQLEQIILPLQCPICKLDYL